MTSFTFRNRVGWLWDGPFCHRAVHDPDSEARILDHSRLVSGVTIGGWGLPVPALRDGAPVPG